MIFVLVGGVALGVTLLVPKLRRVAKGVVQPQIHAARENLHGILTTPRKAVMMFGGNLASQLLFAMVLDASLHAYGASLPFLQLVLINSLASVLGGLAPVPGGLGVIEAGIVVRRGRSVKWKTSKSLHSLLQAARSWDVSQPSRRRRSRCR